MMDFTNLPTRRKTYTGANGSKIVVASSPPDKAHYKAVYTEDLPTSGGTAAMLDDLFFRYNGNRPLDFTGHSLSVGDILALKQGDVVSYHYCDSFGFRELTDSVLRKAAFLLPNARDYLRNPVLQKAESLPKEK